MYASLGLNDLKLSIQLQTWLKDIINPIYMNSTFSSIDGRPVSCGALSSSLPWHRNKEGGDSDVSMGVELGDHLLLYCHPFHRIVGTRNSMWSLSCHWRHLCGCSVFLSHCRNYPHIFFIHMDGPHCPPSPESDRQFQQYPEREDLQCSAFKGRDERHQDISIHHCDLYFKLHPMCRG